MIIWPIETAVASAALDPFTGKAAAPLSARQEAARVRASSKPGAAARPTRRNLLELGLACGEGAAALAARAQQVDAARREADRAAGVGAPGDGAAGATREEDAPGKKAAALDPAAIATLAKEISDVARQRDRLAEELVARDRQQAALQATLMKLLGEHGVRQQPPTPAGARLPMHAWNR